eukprot:s1584_g24.t1
MLRGTDIALKSLNIILAMENIETLDTLEITGLPGLQLMAIDNTTAGSFEFLSKLAKDAGQSEGVPLQCPTLSEGDESCDDVTFEFSAPGRQVLIKVKGFPKEATQHFVAAVEGFASNLGHVNASMDLDVDMREVMAHLSNDTVLYEELYKGIRYSVDASLSKALENLLASKIPDTTVPGAPFSGKVTRLDKVAVARKLFSLFTGASADVKEHYNTTAGSFEFLSKLAKDAGLVEVLRNTSTMFPPAYPFPEPEYHPPEIAEYPVMPETGGTIPPGIYRSPATATTTPLPSYVAKASITENTSMYKFVNS